MYYLNRGGAPEGPFEEAHIAQMIRSGELTQGGVCPVGQNQWWPLQQIPAFAQALAQRAPAAQYGQPSPPQQYGQPPQQHGQSPPQQQYGQSPPPQYGQSPQQYGQSPPQQYGQPPPQQYGQSPHPPATAYGPPPGQGHAPQQSAYGPPPGAAAAQAGHGPAPGYPGAQPSARRTQNEPKKRGGRALIIIGLVSVLLVFLAGSAIGAYLLFFAGGGAPKIAASVPRDAEMLLEVPSLPKLLFDLKDVEYLDTSIRDDKKLFDDTADSVAKAFDVSPGDARAFLVASESFGISARKVATTPEAVVAIGFRSADAVETLLKSPRFIASGALGQTGKRYQLTKKQLQVSVGQDLLLKGLADAELGTGKEVLVWFPQHRLLCIGTELMVTDVARVLETGAASIEQNPSFLAAAKDFDEKARVTGFVDPGVFSSISDPKVKEIVDGYFKPAGPLTGMLTVKSAGFVTSATGRIIGTKLPKASTYEAPQALTLSSRLPIETLGYAAFSTSTKMSGAEAQKLVLDQLAAVDPRSKTQVEQGLAQLEQLLGVSVAKLVDGLGSEAVLGVAAAPDVALDASVIGGGPEIAAKFNVTWVQALKDDSEYKRLAAQLKQKLLPSIREAALTEDGPGFALAPRGAPLPVSLRVKFFDKHLFITAGGNALCDRAEAAFSKADRTLKDDAAHQTALSALPETTHFRLWVDTGRIADTLLKNPLLRARATESGIQLDKFRLVGPQRVTTALSVRSEVENEVWKYRMDALNLQALAPLGFGAAALGGGLRGGLGGARLPPL